MSTSLGYQLFYASSLAEALETLKEKTFHLIISEVDLLDGDGISLFSDLRKKKDLQTAILILCSSKTDTYIQVIGLESGADDYWTKPINKRLYYAKLKSLVALTDKTFRSDQHYHLHINRDKFVVEYKGKEIILPRKEFEILFYLYHNKGNVINRDKIKEEIWTNSEKTVNSRTIDVHIKNIRELIGHKFIKTVKGVGYKFVEY